MVAVPVRWAFAAVLASLLLGTYGFVINDEQDQANALYNLANGSFLIREHASQFFPSMGDIQIEPRFPGPAPVGSTLLDALALPVVLLVRVANALMPLPIWFSGAAALLVWGLLPPAWRTSRSRGLVLVGFVIAAGGFRFAEPDVARFDAVIALQVTNLALLGACAGFIAAAIRRHVPSPAASVATAAVILGPILFWGSKVKYTILAVGLVAAALWVVGEPLSRRRSMALAALAALAVWNNIGPGSVVVAAVGVLLLVETMKGPRARESWIRLGAAVAVGLLCLVPWGIENTIASGSPLTPPYLELDQQVQSDDGRASRPLPVKILRAALDLDNWHGPKDLAQNIAGAWTTGHSVQGNPLGVFALSPLLGLSMWTLTRFPWWRRADLRLAAGLVVFQVLLLSNRAANQGWGLDARLIAPTLPALGLLAGPALAVLAARMTSGDVRRTWLTAGVWGFVLAAALVALAVTRMLPYGLKDADLNHDVLVVLTGLTLTLIAFTEIARAARLLPQSARAMAVGLGLALPVLWTVLAATVTGSGVPASNQPDSVTGFLPLADEFRHRALPPLFGNYPIPVIFENNLTVYHPSYGYCRTQPSPCPW
ncbi:MAG: hypothetical protein WC876_09635 [Candidatus Thermoplasmatota archaeon]|jgi:hypothetical protein